MKSASALGRNRGGESYGISRARLSLRPCGAAAHRPHSLRRPEAGPLRARSRCPACPAISEPGRHREWWGAFHGEGARADYDGNLDAAPIELAQEPDAVEVRHAQVEHDDVGL